ncbi:vacuolar protein sorting/targeting protein PEP1 [Irineochytrium annulatum]|nr:vacuolar protein sorting/targeting protein PEP1 [Irineochytrium annulatum]
MRRRTPAGGVLRRILASAAIGICLAAASLASPSSSPDAAPDSWAARRNADGWTGEGEHSLQRRSEPTYSFKKFDSLPKKLFYFEDKDGRDMQLEETEDRRVVGRDLTSYLEQSIILLDKAGTVWRSSDEGKSWSIPNALKGEHIVNVIQHSFSRSDRAYAMTADKKHYVTSDSGASWKSFETPLKPAFDLKMGLAFHATEKDWVIFKGTVCVKDKSGYFERTFGSTVMQAHVTKNNFGDTKPLLTYVADCVWGRSSKEFVDVDTETIYCLEWPENEKNADIPWHNAEKLKLVKSSDFFKGGSEDVINISGGVVALGVVQSFMVAAVKPKNSDGMELFVSTDGKEFTRADLPSDVGLRQDAYTILKSSEHRLTIDILALPPSSAIVAQYGSLLFSNSDGTLFTRSLSHTNRNSAGQVDFERVQANKVSGLIITNVVDNWEEVQRGGVMDDEKKLVTKMSYDDGARWSLLRPPQKDADGKSWSCSPSANGEISPKCALHLHSTTTSRNVGKVFSSSGAPGFILGVGNVGSHLKPYESCDTFISTDGGWTWSSAAKGPHKYETADMGSLIVLVPDAVATDYIMYSTHRGAPDSWQKVHMKPDGVDKWRAGLTDIDSDSTSSKMIIFLTDDDQQKYYVAQIDLSKVHSRQCKSPPSDDFEKWSASDAASTTCTLGERVYYWRRKADAECYVGKKYDDPKEESTVCECKEEDFECDFHFKRVGEGSLKCEPFGPAYDQPAECRVGETYPGSSGYRKIPGDKCQGGKALDEKVKKDCSGLPGGGGVVKQPPSGKDPKVAAKIFDADVEKIIYMKGSKVIFLLTEDGKVFRSGDEGMTWESQSVFTDDVLLIASHDVEAARAYFLTDTDVFYTVDRLESSSSLKKMDTPQKSNRLGVGILDFHPKEPDYLVYVGGRNGCPKASECFTEVYLTKDSGKTWLNDKKPVETWATKCVWAQDVGFAAGTSLKTDDVYCASYKYKNGKVSQEELGGRGTRDNPLQLVLIKNGGKEKQVLISEGVVNFYVVESVLAVAVESHNELKLKVSVDGVNFADAKFPPNLKIEKNAFTVLESNTGAVFMDVSQNVHYLEEYGALFKSNSNGTFYSRILEYSNRNDKGQVDFEKMKGIPGIVFANSVSNPHDLASGSKKKVKSVISFDDGAHWQTLKPPAKDSTGADIKCNNSNECFLNLYCKTSAHDDNYGKSSAPTASSSAGIMLGVGNVGPSLAPYTEGNVFITTDAGRTWKEVRKEAHKWAIGDHGGMIVMAYDEGPTDIVAYTWNYGQSWAEYKFSSSPVRIHSINTEPTATSLKFLILAAPASSKRSSESKVFTIDFEGTLSRTCDKPGKNSKDFKDWSPTDGGTGNDRCFLGREIGYWRRNDDALCHVGSEFKDTEQTEDPCQCTKSDYECDYNFYFDSNSAECKLVGDDPLQPSNCKAGTEYDGSPGYRKIPMSKCTGGLKMPETVPRVCGESKAAGDVKVTSTIFKHPLADYFYFNRTKSVVIRDASGNVWMSQDAGMSWEQPDTLKKTDVDVIMRDPHRGDRAFFITDEKTQFVAESNGTFIRQFDVPSRPNHMRADILATHPDDANYLLWTGEVDCEAIVSDNCHTETYASTDGGKNWNSIAKYAVRCMWGRDKDFRGPSKDTIFCDVYDVDSGNMRGMTPTNTEKVLKKSTDLGKSWEVVLEKSAGFAISYEYMVAAKKTDTSILHLSVTMDGTEWATAVFKDDEKIPDYGYTLLDSSTGSIFLEVFSDRQAGAEHGTLYKSNGNGTFFEIMRDKVNQNKKGYTDFEKVQGIAGISILNVVINKSVPKRLQTLISFSDGQKFDPLRAPLADSNGDSYNCNSDAACTLHLHHFTERSDLNDQFSSTGAVGLMVGVGNVGSYLTDVKDANTFMTRDAGRSWIEVAKGPYFYEFGDRGGVILMAQSETPTEEIRYSLDEGLTWTKMFISDSIGGGRLRVTHIITESYGSSSSFVIFGRISGGSRDGEVAAIQVDFENVWEKSCVLDLDNEALSDFEIWNPTGQDSTEGGCMFGEKINYRRRKADRHCRVGDMVTFPETAKVGCPCTADDFECAEGFFRNGTNDCAPMEGFQFPEPQCVNGIKSYTTGYKRHRKTKCVGGLALDRDRSKEIACAGKISGFGWFMIILVSVGIPAGLTYAILWHRRGGRIRLPLEDEQRRGREPPSDWREFVNRGLSTAAVTVAELGEITISKGRDAYEWVRERVTGARRSSGYAPVRNVQTAIDEELDNDPLMDIDDY